MKLLATYFEVWTLDRTSTGYTWILVSQVETSDHARDLCLSFAHLARVVLAYEEQRVRAITFYAPERVPADATTKPGQILTYRDHAQGSAAE